MSAGSGDGGVRYSGGRRERRTSDITTAVTATAMSRNITARIMDELALGFL
jgi:hypothetical protein